MYEGHEGHLVVSGRREWYVWVVTSRLTTPQTFSLRVSHEESREVLESPEDPKE